MDHRVLMYVCVLPVWSNPGKIDSFLYQQAVPACLLFGLSHLCVLRFTKWHSPPRFLLKHLSFCHQLFSAMLVLEL